MPNFYAEKFGILKQEVRRKVMAISFEMHQKFDLLDKLLSYHDEMFLIVMKEQLGVVDMNYKFIFHPQENTETSNYRDGKKR